MPDQMPDEQTPQPVGNQTARLVVTWLVVTVPLAYGLFETIKGVVPLFTS
ncbi:hypothetical protein ACFQBY_04130 [Promicromonospora citrea]|uniref:Uncharacterized protein n=1 Tax=Promicromonospora citrea TaxID=43677 RepID=A0A8H9GH99_9MICO|nr:hypothetical protein [Promicromonospora citrea]NNH51226.1 hypothetical protein [Promicromonospora citrea]GGM26009.1 hypothetical protein GCM10010102_22120 [Promicromonospora citrea]